MRARAREQDRLREQRPRHLDVLGVATSGQYSVSVLRFEFHQPLPLHNGHMVAVAFECQILLKPKASTAEVTPGCFRFFVTGVDELFAVWTLPSVR